MTFSELKGAKRIVNLVTVFNNFSDRSVTLMWKCFESVIKPEAKKERYKESIVFFKVSFLYQFSKSFLKADLLSVMATKIEEIHHH